MGGSSSTPAMRETGSAMAEAASTAPMGSGTQQDLTDRFRQPGATVPLGALADIRIVSGPPRDVCWEVHRITSTPELADHSVALF